MPPLQGPNIDDHFRRIGIQFAQPWLDIARDCSSNELPPKRDHWDIQSRLTKYHFLAQGSSHSEHVEFLQHDGNVEEMSYKPCITLTPSWDVLPRRTRSPAGYRPVVGHYACYDRVRILGEYSSHGTQTHFLDIITLHVAVNGTSFQQRPAWMKYHTDMRQEVKHDGEVDGIKLEDVRRLCADLEKRLPQLEYAYVDAEEADLSSKH
ncbi:hypothetical protein K503DRAFT_801619 [Rhizopogon vinicolor AM-OR11-026]|uniref:DNA mitochondrial polymerase exonuclease domain-containing protein n=1 Tax=Rhizopogon vinicolor AM-OR11-026 TaxID=1314800 RepID=A0A1B7MWG6_9AGAM|nr:hypothetical protein K503DRAFT_801619 [Rhizopogon vinicolor AM-OR11-026]